MKVKDTGTRVSSVNVNMGQDGPKMVMLSVNPSVDISNEIHHSQDAKRVAAIDKQLKALGALLKKEGLKVKLIPYTRTERVGLSKLEVGVPKALLSTGGSGGKWGIKVTSGDGKQSHVFTGTQHSLGPWDSKDVASMHVRDLQEQLAYDDDFKHPTFQVVPV
jgi:hypothetical protein